MTEHGVLENHITNVALGPDVINAEELMEVEISGLMVSCTRFIKAIKFMDEDERITICDSPGIEDTRGPELDISNIYGVVLAAKACKSIVPVIVLSEKGMGLRMTGLKRIS